MHSERSRYSITETEYVKTALSYAITIKMVFTSVQSVLLYSHNPNTECLCESWREMLLLCLSGTSVDVENLDCHLVSNSTKSS